jgi:hypothetical protein
VDRPLSTPNTTWAWATQPPWLHQFCFRWTSAHPITKPGAVRGWVTLCFLAHLAREFFFTHGPTLPTQLPRSKKKSHLPHSSIYVKIFCTCGPTLLTQLPRSKKISHSSIYVFFFFKTLFLFCHHCHYYCHKLKKWCHRSLMLLMYRGTKSCCNFKVWVTQGATSSRRHENKVHVLHFFLHLRFFYIFSLGLGLWDLCFASFKVH